MVKRIKKSKNIKISVIVPFLNEEKYIGDCINALLHQTFPSKNYEVIFVDNGSSDNSANIVKKFKQVKLLRELNDKGCYAPRNKGLKVARGDIIAFTDADCEVSSSWLSKIWEVFKDKKVIALIGKRKNANSRDFFLKICEDYENIKAKMVVEKLPKQYRYAYGNNMAMRKLVFNQTGPFTIYPPLSGDVEMIQRISNTYIDAKIMYVDQVWVRHLELDNLWLWFRKLKSYGEQCKLLETISTHQNLRLRDNLSIYFEVAKKYKYSKTKKVVAICILFIGTCMYRFGSFKARLYHI